jgi:hypothetical protein
MKRTANSIIQGAAAFSMLLGQQNIAFAQVGVAIQDGNAVTLGNSTVTTVCATPTTNPCTNNQLERAIMSAVQAPIPAQNFTVSVGGMGMLVEGANNASAVMHVCSTFTSLTFSVATTLQIIGASSGKAIYICDYDLTNGTATVLQFQIGTGTNCASANATLGMPWQLGANSGVKGSNNVYRGMNSGAVGSAALCLNSTVTSVVGVQVYYDQLSAAP